MNNGGREPATRKQVVNLFWILCAGYGAVWAIMALKFAYDPRTIDTLSIFLIAAIFSYPPFAFARLFYRQTGKPIWLYSSWLGLAFCGALIAWMITDLITGLIHRQFQTIVYFAIGYPVGIISSCIIIGAACVWKRQKIATKVLGYLSLSLLFLFVMVYLAFILEGVDSSKYLSLDQLVAFPLLFLSVTGIPAVLFAVFGGLVEEI